MTRTLDGLAVLPEDRSNDSLVALHRFVAQLRLEAAPHRLGADPRVVDVAARTNTHSAPFFSARKRLFVQMPSRYGDKE